MGSEDHTSIEETLRIGDLLMTSTHRQFPTLICAITHGDYSHVTCYAGKGKMVHSRVGKGVNVSSIDDYDWYDVFEIPEATDEHRRSAVKYMLKLRGRGYDYSGLIGITAAKAREQKENGLDNPERFWCSELILDEFSHVGWRLVRDRGNQIVSPQDLAISDKVRFKRRFEKNEEGIFVPKTNYTPEFLRTACRTADDSSSFSSRS